MPWQEMATLSRSLWHWVAPPAIAIICLMIMVSCSIWFLKQVLVAFVVPTRNHVQSPQADEQNPHRGHSLQGCRNTALESKILHSLPTSEFEKKTEDDELTGTKDEECAICLGEFGAGERLRHLPSCNHAFHMSCIDTWFRSHSTCPTCRTAVCGPSKLQEC